MVSAPKDLSTLIRSFNKIEIMNYHNYKVIKSDKSDQKYTALSKYY